MQRVALVTGASRGIGRKAALHLAEAGFEVAIAARTERPGESQDAYPDGTPYAGSLEETAREIAALNGRAIPIRFDLRDRSSAEAVIAATLDAFGQIDVLVNNALSIDAATNARLMEADPQVIANALDANVVTPLVLAQRAIAAMQRRGEGGAIVNLSSIVHRDTPPAPTGEGGWSFGYAAVKAALTRLTTMIHVEHACEGIHSWAIEPGCVPTDAFKSAFPPEILPELLKSPAMSLVSEDVPGAVIRWLASAPEASRLSGQVLDCETVCREYGLLPEEKIKPELSTGVT
ncbi:MAG: oxidoreductase [Deltaproteobacteria bacterium]|nr:oxidoreductase [Deltaproteobacteria bacterium]